jgi:hypothetical protein
MSWVYKKITHLVIKHPRAFHVDPYVMVEELLLEKDPLSLVPNNRF